MTPEERYHAILHKKQLDEKYLEKQLLKISQNKSDILLEIRKRKRKSKYKSSNKLIQINNLLKLTNLNKHTAVNLLIKNRHVKSLVYTNNTLSNLTDIVKLIKSI